MLAAADTTQSKMAGIIARPEAKSAESAPSSGSAVGMTMLRINRLPGRAMTTEQATMSQRSRRTRRAITHADTMTAAGAIDPRKKTMFWNVFMVPSVCVSGLNHDPSQDVEAGNGQFAVQLGLDGRPLFSVFPAKAGTQIHPEQLVGFTWAPAFAGETEGEYGVGNWSGVPSVLSHSRTRAWGTTRPASTSASAKASAASSGKSSGRAGGMLGSTVACLFIVS